ncbi:preprotein translocase subunit SecE [bacterium]|nr:preprotein translocase subunit SecE [bacterium]
MSRLIQIWKETADELLNKVTWPTWDELRNSTWIVIITSVLFAVAIAIVDKLFSVFTADFIYELLR